MATVWKGFLWLREKGSDTPAHVNTPVSSQARGEVGQVRPVPVFVTTHWSVVMSAATGESTDAGSALEHLCQTYWYPLYADARRRGHSVEDAQDLTQAFFARLLERHWVADADRQRGRFRTFLLPAMSRFMADEWDKARAQKRGGGITHVPLQLDEAETRYGCEPPDERTPEQYFERRWALTLLDAVLRRLQAEYAREGKAQVFEALNSALAGGRESQPYAQLASRAGMSEGAVKVAVHRLRKRYRHMLREEIARTMAVGADVDEELRQLFAVLAEA